MRFRATLELNGKTATGIEVPANVLDGLAAGKRPAVRVTINGYTYATSVGSMGGRSLLPVSADVRKHAGATAGEVVEVTVEVDTTPREVAVPDDLAELLEHDAGAKRRFETLSFSRKQRLVLPIEQAKAAETRRRRVEKAIEALREGRA
ncbi:MAG: YdeI/OmpD-associated family protein [Candidatus Dormiibacterota bacterium]